MNLDQFNLALKLIQQDYNLSEAELERLTWRLLADDKEFERLWSELKNRQLGKVDTFRELLAELVS